jgi:hypothetical protein
MPYIPCESPVIVPKQYCSLTLKCAKRCVSVHPEGIQGGGKVWHGGPFVRKGVLLSVRPMMYYAYPVRWLAARSDVRKLQSKCLRIATSATWYTGSRKINEDLGVPFFTGHIRSLRDSTKR